MLDYSRFIDDLDEGQRDMEGGELQLLFDRYCNDISLPLFPSSSRQTSTKSSLLTDDDDEESLWAEADTRQVLDGMAYDVHLGLKLYHSDPMDRISAAYQVNGKLFIDYEFCVHEAFATELNSGEQITPGIITQQNIEDFSKSSKRVARIQHFMKRARRRSTGINSSCERWTWTRGSAMRSSSKKRLFTISASSICSQNVIQGGVGNCGFCSGFASLAQQFPQVIRQAFGGNNYSASMGIMDPSGAISICIHPQHGRKRFLLMDDYLLCIAGTTTSPSIHSLDEDEIWIRFLEKVFVKLQSSYASLDGFYKYNSLYRHPARAIQLITNAPVAVELHYKGQPIGRVYEVLLATEGKCVRVAHGRKATNGLLSGHGYSLLWIGKIADVPLVCLRNPHGTRSYTGEFGRGRKSWRSVSAVKVASELSSKLNGSSSSALKYIQYLYLTSRTVEDNGVFFMRCSAFIECFPIVSVVGPIKNDFVVPLGILRRNSLYSLHGEKISGLCEILNLTS